MIAIGAIVLSLLIAWSPWITRDYAENLVLEKFNESWYGVMDGCGSYNQEKDIIAPERITSSKTIFGCNVYLGYHCGMKPSLEQNDVFVSSFGTVQGL